ncbi:MAG: hypothetical protein WB611_12990 [Stellaceae bacterium]
MVMDLRRHVRRRDAGLGRKIDGGTRAQAIAAARMTFVVLMLR